MPNCPSPKNVQRALRVDRELDAKVLKRFRIDPKMTVKDTYILALMFATRDVQLSAKNYEQIALEERQAMRRR